MENENTARDLTKAMLRMPAAILMFGVSQTANLMTPDRGWNDSRSAMDNVSANAESEMGDTAGSLYRAWDHLQTGMVDAFFDLASGSWSEPRKAVSDAWDAIDRSWSNVRDEVSKKSSDDA